MSPTTADPGIVGHLGSSSAAGVALVGDLALRLADQVIVGCAEHGIVLMPLKGVLLLSRWPSLRGRRDLVDVDLLVRPSDLEAVTHVLRGQGFEPTVRSSAGIAMVSEAWPLSIDLHRTLFPHGLFRASTDELFSRGVLDASLFSAPVVRMTNPDLFAHLIGHFVKGRGNFGQDTSLDDLRWLAREGVLGAGEGYALGAHLRQLGLQRAAGYVLGHESLQAEPFARATLQSLRLSRLDRIAVAAARMGTATNRGTPRWWTPHLLDHSLVAGSRSFVAHTDEAARRLIGHVTGASGAVLRARSAID